MMKLACLLMSLFLGGQKVDRDARDYGILTKVILVPQAQELVPWAQSDSLAYHLAKYSQELELPMELLAKMIWVESRGDTSAVHPRSGATGLLQVMPELWLGVFPECGDNLFSEHTNMCYGAHILRLYLDKVGDIDHALNLYSGFAKRYGAGRSPYHAMLEES